MTESQAVMNAVPLAQSQKKSIHIIDDHADYCELLTMFFENEGYKVRCDLNGQTALEYLRTSEIPSVILLNHKMPGMDGFEFREIQVKDLRLVDVPVIMVTASVPNSIFKRLCKAKLQGFVQKPFCLVQLLADVVRLTQPELVSNAIS